MRAITAIVLLVLLGSSLACVPTPPPTPTPTPVPTAAERTITLADSGQTITMRVGERFLLDLGANFDWTVNIDDPSVVSRVVNVLTIVGSQGLYEAHKAGRAELTATGDPLCRKSTPPCAAPSILFKLTIIVQ